MEKVNQNDTASADNRTANPEIKRRACITFALEVKQAFELYAYGIITHEAFVSRTQELNEGLTYSLKQAERHNFE